MDKIWYRDDLRPEPTALEHLLEGVKSPVDRQRYEQLRRPISVYEPRLRVLDPASAHALEYSNSNFCYILVRLGCEFDPDIEQRANKVGFASATFEVWMSSDIGPLRVYALTPEQENKGGPRPVRVTFEPKIAVHEGPEFSTGNIATDFYVGRVAAITRGFKGPNEREPRWELQDHREAPLYGMRHFWMCLEVSPTLQAITFTTVAEGEIYTKAGGLKMVTSMPTFELRPQITVPIG